MRVNEHSSQRLLQMQRCAVRYILARAPIEALYGLIHTNSKLVCRMWIPTSTTNTPNRAIECNLGRRTGRCQVVFDVVEAENRFSQRCNTRFLLWLPQDTCEGTMCLSVILTPESAARLSLSHDASTF
jgi:hypothetical protein